MTNLQNNQRTARGHNGRTSNSPKRPTSKVVAECKKLLTKAMEARGFFVEGVTLCSYKQLLNVARIALNDFGLSKKETLNILKEFYNGWSDYSQRNVFGNIKELRKIIDEAGRHPSIHPHRWRRTFEYEILFREGDYHIGFQRYLLKPHRTRPIAEVFINEYYTQNGQKTLRYYGGQYYKWDGRCYIPYDAEELKTEIHRFLTEEAAIETVREFSIMGESKYACSDFPAGDRNVREVLAAIQGLVRLPSNAQPNSWIGEGDAPCDAGNLIFGPTKVYDWQRHIFRNSDPGWFNLTCLPIDVDMKAARPRRFQRFLKELFGTDHEAIECLEEYLGLLLASVTAFQKMLLLVGPKRSGKGTLIRLMTAILGQNNVSSPRTSDFSSRFGLQDLIGKSLAVVSDARFSGADIQKAIEVMLNITGEDHITVDIKYKSPVTLRLGTRIIILSNEEPRLPDASGAIISRFIALKLTNSFYDHEDIHLEQKLLAELPGVLKILVKGLQRLMKRGRFIQPASGQDVLSEMSKLGNPIREFVEERCQIGSGLRCNIGKLYLEWTNWCQRNGISPGAKNIFCRNLHAAFSGLSKREGTDGNFYEGIDLIGRKQASKPPESATEN